MYRIFGNINNIDGEEFLIPEEDKSHLSRVLRFKEGETFEAVVDGILYELVYMNYDRAKIVSYSKIRMNRSPKINLFFSILKGDKTEFVLQKCTEIGLDNFYPMITMRTVSNIKGKELQKQERWQKIVNEASKQSKSNFIPKVHYPINIASIIDHIKIGDFTILCYEEEKSNSIKETLEKYKEGDINLIIGPEGGFEPVEVINLIRIGAQSVTLGEKILRAETASIVALSNLVYEFKL